MSYQFIKVPVSVVKQMKFEYKTELSMFLWHNLLSQSWSKDHGCCRVIDLEEKTGIDKRHLYKLLKELKLENAFAVVTLDKATGLKFIMGRNDDNFETFVEIQNGNFTIKNSKLTVIKTGKVFELKYKNSLIKESIFLDKKKQDFVLSCYNLVPKSVFTSAIKCTALVPQSVLANAINCTTLAP